MKKLLKRIALVLGIIFLLLMSAIGVALWLVFTPERLTPIVQKQAAQFINCQSEIGRVELTFFSTFPRFGLKVSKFAIVNPTPNAQSDTLARVNQLVGVIDLKEYWKYNNIVLNELIVHNGVANVFIDSLGKTNFDIFPSDTVIADTATTQQNFKLNIQNIELNGVDFTYIDQQNKILADVKSLVAQFSGSMDSANFKSNITVTNSNATFALNGEYYLNKASLKLKVPSSIALSGSYFEFDDSEFSINDISLFFKGTVENDSLSKRVNTNVEYHTNNFSIPSLIALVPTAFKSSIQGIELDGMVNSDGKITGSYSVSEMPLLHIHVALADGSVKYSALPWLLSKVNADIEFHSDLTNDSITYIKISKFNANTPLSSFSTSGKINHLFSDISVDLTTQTPGFNMVDLLPLIPDSVDISVKGVVDGSVRTTFTMSQLEKLSFDKMKISGFLNLAKFDLIYDTVFLKTDKSRIQFSLPNPNHNIFSKFLSTKIQTNNLVVGTINGKYSATITNGTIALETSNVMDSTKLPDITCDFEIEDLTASTDTIHVDIFNPKGKVVMLSEKGLHKRDEVTVSFSNSGLSAKAGLSAVSMSSADLTANILNFLSEPKIKFNLHAENIDAAMDGNSLIVSDFSVSADVVNDLSQTDTLLQWMPNGALSLKGAKISSSMLNSELEIPSIIMDFSPEQLNVKESKLKIDSSDFSLSGTLSNMLSYYRGDSLLKGNFDFVSEHTDVLQLMSLTSGIGNEEADSSAQANSDSLQSTGPYMVPKGIDFTLNTKIERAYFGTEIARDISGEVRVKDGLLVLDALKFTTPASRMQLTAMYRTPRKNHIYAGFDYHMLDINIEDLLTMVPDLDSIMPMLKSFKGSAEFHFAAETYMDSLYNPKKSTIRGVSSIKARDLVLMDGETFTEIAKTLRFTKQAENKVDSLSAEFTIFKQEIDIYPFMIVMDKYKAVVAGRHNMDMSFSYNISLLESPLPMRICVDVSGTIDDLKYKPVKCQYRDLYRPTSRMLLQNKQMELRRMIRESLVSKVVAE